VTLPEIEADAACEAVPDCCPKDGVAHIKTANSKTPQSDLKSHLPQLRRTFNDSLQSNDDYEILPGLAYPALNGCVTSSRSKQQF
jgi:hypothetical protein